MKAKATAAKAKVAILEKAEEKVVVPTSRVIVYRGAVEVWRIRVAVVLVPRSPSAVIAIC